MNCELSKYKGMSICVAVSGGKDSMSLLHLMSANAKTYGITLSALNCDHTIRGKASADDSRFVKEECARLGVPLISFVWTQYSQGEITSGVEEKAREWRHECYLTATKKCILPDGNLWKGADCVALAHHANDNAETVIFNIMRGTSASGLTGIKDCEIYPNGECVKVIRPLINCTREEIDAYVQENAISFVVDNTNFSNDYTRNKIRNVLIPVMQEISPALINAMTRLSLLCERDEEYFNKVIKDRGLFNFERGECFLSFCEEKVIFSRLCLLAFKSLNVKDYTFEAIERLYALQFKQNGKKFCFLCLTAFKEEGRIVICRDEEYVDCEISLSEYFYKDCEEFCSQSLSLIKTKASQSFLVSATSPYKTLYLDADKVSPSAVIRFFKNGDVFEKFGGGTKKLGDYFTDKKIPSRLRRKIPLIVDGNNVLCVCGVEISKSVELDDKSVNAFCITSNDYNL